MIKQWWDSKSEKEKDRFVNNASWLVSTLGLACLGFAYGRKYERKHILDKGDSFSIGYDWSREKNKLVVNPQILDKKGDVVLNCGYGYYPEDQARAMASDILGSIPTHDTVIITNNQALIEAATTVTE